MGPKTLEEIIIELQNRALVFSINKATEALLIMVGAMEKDGNIIISKDIESSGFFLVNDKIEMYNTNYHLKHSREKVIDCLKKIEI